MQPNWAFNLSNSLFSICHKIRLNMTQVQLWNSQRGIVILRGHSATEFIAANHNKQCARSRKSRCLSSDAPSHGQLFLQRPRHLAITSAQTEQEWWVAQPHCDQANATAEM